MADRHRGNRHPNDPDRLFAFPVRVPVGGGWCRLLFAVDDATAAACLIVDSFTTQD